MEQTTKSNEITLITNVVKEKELRKAQKRALEFFSDAVQNTYGPMGGYTAYSYGSIDKSVKAVQSNYTKDGFTVLKHLDTDKPIESLLREEIRDICTSVIKVIGDGTTSAVMLSNYIFQGLLNLQENGYSKRSVIKHFKNVIKTVVQRIEENKHDATLEDIYNIALTSLNGQEEYAEIIKKIYEQNGMNVFIDVAVSNNKDTIVKTYNGMTYDTGYISPCFVNNPMKKSCELPNPEIYVFESPIDTPAMINLLQLIVEQNIEKPAVMLRQQQQNAGNKLNKKNLILPVPTLIICPHISRDANSYIDSLISAFSNAPIENRLPLCIVAGIHNNNQYLLDIMNLTGAKFIKKYIDPETYEKDKEAGLAPTPATLRTFAGHADQIICDALSTRIINPANMYEKDTKEYSTFFTNYIDQLKDLLHKYEETREELVKIGRLKRRINILQGNMVDLFVGGIGISDRDSLRDSIEDAVLNCRSAAKEGVGYGANYEGLRVLNQLSIEANNEKENFGKNLNDLNEKYQDRANKEFSQIIIRQLVVDLIFNAYVRLCKQLYLPYCDDNDEQASALLSISLASKDEDQLCPFNIITESYDKRVLTSIKTEPAMLEAISKIISLLFDTNQFILPDARFNIYEMTNQSSITTIKNE